MRYLAFMSLPVSYIVSMTLSSETRGSLVRRMAMRAALIAFTDAMALLLDARNLHLAGNWVAGEAQVMFHPDFCRDANLFRLAPRSSARPAAAMEQAARQLTPDSRLPRQKWRRSSYTGAHGAGRHKVGI